MKLDIAATTLGAVILVAGVAWFSLRVAVVLTGALVLTAGLFVDWGGE